MNEWMSKQITWSIIKRIPLSLSSLHLNVPLSRVIISVWKIRGREKRERQESAMRNSFFCTSSSPLLLLIDDHEWMNGKGQSECQRVNTGPVFVRVCVCVCLSEDRTGEVGTSWEEGARSNYTSLYLLPSSCFMCLCDTDLSRSLRIWKAGAFSSSPSLSYLVWVCAGCA